MRFSQAGVLHPDDEGSEEGGAGGRFWSPAPECRGPRWPAGLGFKGPHHLAGSLSGEQETHSLSSLLHPHMMLGRTKPINQPIRWPKTEPTLLCGGQAEGREERRKHLRLFLFSVLKRFLFKTKINL